jgi:hypothetical protein
LSGLKEVTLEQELWTVKSVAQETLCVFTVEDVSELITQLSITHEDVLPLSKGEHCGRKIAAFVLELG